MVEFLRRRNARDYAITTPNAVDEAKYVELGQIQQWITIRGENRDNPVLLFLHGGPGDATNPWSYAVFRTWLKHFTVVQWDQRGTGKTLGKNGSSLAPTITLDRMTQDGLELAELLRKSLRQGQDRPRRSLLGIDPRRLHGQSEARSLLRLRRNWPGCRPSPNVRRRLRRASKKAEALGESTRHSRARGSGSTTVPDGRGYGVQRRWSNLFEGADTFIASMLGLAMMHRATRCATSTNGPTGRA